MLAYFGLSHNKFSICIFFSFREAVHLSAPILVVTFFFVIMFVFNEKRLIIEFRHKESFDYIRDNDKF